MIDPKLYRPCVGMMLLNPQNLVFVGQRLDKVAEAWQMPQGGIDEGETPTQAAMRELMEEVGTNDVQIIAQSNDWLHYDLPPDLCAKFWGGRYVGQRQKWFLMRLNQSATINISTPHPEFSEYRWVEYEQLVPLAVTFKQQLYRDVISGFAQYF